MKKPAAKMPAGSSNETVRRLSVKVRAAEEHFETTRRLALLTKRKLKAARRAHKLARKVAKRARKETGRLREALKVAAKKSGFKESPKTNKITQRRAATPPNRKVAKQKRKRRLVQSAPKRVRTHAPTEPKKVSPDPESLATPPGEAPSIADTPTAESLV